MTAPLPELDRLAAAAPRPGPPEAEIALRLVPVDRLRVDPAYQRHISDRGKRAIRRMIEAFSWPRFGALAVAEAPNGDLWVIDGQHRALAAQMLGIEAVPAVVCRAETAQQAADFVGINTNRTAVGSQDRFRAALAAGEPEAQDLAETLAQLGIGWDAPPTGELPPMQTRAVTRLRTLHRQYGGTLYTALEAMVEAQPDQPGWLTSTLIAACTLATDAVLAAEGDMDRLVATMRDLDPDTLLEEARGIARIEGGAIARHAARRILSKYNHGQRKPARLTGKAA